MVVSSLRLIDIKGFQDSGEIALSPGLNVLVGHNNAGKSTLLKALYRLQIPSALTSQDVRKGAEIGKVLWILGQTDQAYLLPVDHPNRRDGRVINLVCNTGLNPQNQTLIQFNDTQGMGSFEHILPTAPVNFVYPFLSKRKVTGFNEDVREGNVNYVQDNFSNLTARVDQLRDANHPRAEEFAEACRSILGFAVGTFSSLNGKQIGFYVDEFSKITLEQMGEGTAHLLGLITDLVLAKNKLFIIEELENDIHPKALKKLLDLVVEKSATNQFVFSTHSNIVVKHLGSHPGSKVFSVSMEFEDRLPTSHIHEVVDPAERRALLEDLGYELGDFDLWKGWIILEESTAESIILRCLIPWFAPDLNGVVRTIAARGISKVEPKFEDFDRLFLFTHLESVYHNRAWVAVDGDEPGLDTISSLKARYKSWDPNHFVTFKEEDFERYYPTRFQAEADAAFKIADKQKKREAKRLLLEKVLAWVKEDEELAQREFSVSAKEVIDFLKTIEAKLAAV